MLQRKPPKNGSKCRGGPKCVFACRANSGIILKNGRKGDAHMRSRRPDAIVRRLEQAGFAAYFVGGCVRDTLLCRPVHDWDVTTSARPEQVLALFAHCVPTGIRHGTVTVFEDGAQAEVTTFRADGAYHDGRHPDAVSFVTSLRGDLARRDFTVNAMAMDLRGNLYDYHGGQDDLRAGILRAVGQPETRFREDALRMLRACRFAAQLGFRLDAATEAAVFACVDGCAALSHERIREETEKTLLSPRPQLLEKMLSAGLLRPCGLARTARLDWLAEVPCEQATRWTALKILLPELSPEVFRLPSGLGVRITRAAAAYTPEPDMPALKRIAAERGAETAALVAQLAGKSALWEQLLASGDCISLRQLAVTGRDLPALSGAQVGRTLRRLLAHVLVHPEDNTRETLLRLAQEESQ